MHEPPTAPASTPEEPRHPAGAMREMIPSPTGTALPVMSWRRSAPRAVVLVCRVPDESGGWYGEVANELAAHGYAVFMVDHREPGQPGDKPREEDVGQFEASVANTYMLAGHARAVYPETPRILLGHSAGGLVAVRCALDSQDEARAMIVSGLPINVPGQAPLARLLGRFSPRRPSAPGAGTDTETRRAAAAIRARFADLALPLLAMHGAADRLAAPRGTVMLYDESSSRDKVVVVWPGQHHDIFNDTDRERVIAFTLDWLNTRFPPR